MIKPYVYIIQNIERTHWYVGYKQKPKAGEDYWGSSRYLKELMAQTGKENWEKTIIKEFDDPNEAHEFEQLMLEFMWSWPGRVNKSRSGYIDYSDPDVRMKHQTATKIANKLKSQDPEYRAKIKSINQSMVQDPVWIMKQKIGAQKRSQNPDWLVKNKTINQAKATNPDWIAKNKASGKQRSQTTEWREAMQKRSQNPEWIAKNKAANQRRSKPFIATCIATGEEYFCESSTCDQAKKLGLNSGNISACLNGKTKSYKGFTFRPL